MVLFGSSFCLRCEEAKSAEAKRSDSGFRQIDAAASVLSCSVCAQRGRWWDYRLKRDWTGSTKGERKHSTFMFSSDDPEPPEPRIGTSSLAGRASPSLWWAQTLMSSVKRALTSGQRRQNGGKFTASRIKRYRGKLKWHHTSLHNKVQELILNLSNEMLAFNQLVDKTIWTHKGAIISAPFTLQIRRLDVGRCFYTWKSSLKHSEGVWFLLYFMLKEELKQKNIPIYILSLKANIASLDKHLLPRRKK